MSEINSILADVKVEGTDPFKDIGEKAPAESQTEKEQGEKGKEKAEEGEKTPDDNLPFHEHPRWKERETELKTLRDRDEAREKEMAELRSFREEVSSKLKGDSTEIPKWFGGDLEAWKLYQTDLAEERKRIREELKSEAKAEAEQAKAQEDYWNSWVQDELDKLEKSGKKFDRNELIKVMLETRPTDQNGNFDFEAGFKTYEYRQAKEVDPEKSRARKQLADITTKTSKGEAKQRDYRTPADFKGRGFHIPI